MTDLPLVFTDRLGNVYDTDDGGVVLSTTKGSRAFSTIDKVFNFSGMKHTEGGYIKNDYPNGRYRITYKLLKKDDNSPDTIYLCTGGNPEAIAVSTNIELNIDYTYEFEIRNRFLAISAMDAYDKNGTTEFKLIRLEQLEIFPEDLSQTLPDESSEIIFEGDLTIPGAYSRFIGYFTAPKLGYYTLSFTPIQSEQLWKTDYYSNDLIYKVVKDRTTGIEQYTDTKSSGTHNGTSLIPLLPDNYKFVVNLNKAGTNFRKFTAKITFAESLEIEEIDGKYWKVSYPYADKPDKKAYALIKL